MSSAALRLLNFFQFMANLLSAKCSEGITFIGALQVHLVACSVNAATRGNTLFTLLQSLLCRTRRIPLAVNNSFNLVDVPFLKNFTLTLVCYSLSRCISTSRQIHGARFFSTAFNSENCHLDHLVPRLIFHSEGSSEQLPLKVSDFLHESCAALQTKIANTFWAWFYSMAMNDLPKWLHLRKAEIGQRSLSFQLNINVFLLLLSVPMRSFIYFLNTSRADFVSSIARDLSDCNPCTSSSEARQLMQVFFCIGNQRLPSTNLSLQEY